MSIDISPNANTIKSRYWLYQSIFWGCFLSFQLAYSIVFPPIRAINIIVAILVTVHFLIASHVMRYLYKRFAANWSALAVISWSLLIVPIMTMLAQAAIFLWLQLLLIITPDLLEGMRVYSWQNFLLYSLNTAPFLILWSIIYLLITLSRKVQATETAYWKSQAQLRDTELQFLHNQINSHFLFNAMNNVRALILENPQLARDRLTQLANILRATLVANNSDLVPLKDELEIVKAYLDLETLQYEDRITVKFDIDSHIENSRLPPMLLQTLVENAVKHGIAQSSQGGTIHIRGKQQARQAEIQIENPLGKQLHQSTQKGHGIGLHNTRLRIQKAFGDLAELRLNQNENTFTASLLIPL